MRFLTIKVKKFDLEVQYFGEKKTNNDSAKVWKDLKEKTKGRKKFFQNLVYFKNQELGLINFALYQQKVLLKLIIKILNY